MKSFVLVLAFCFTFFPAASQADDLQYWSAWSVAGKIEERNTVSAFAEMFAKNDMSDDYVYYLYATYVRNIVDGFSLLGQGYFESVQTGDNQWSTSRFLVVGPIYKLPLTPTLQLKSQLRFYYLVEPESEWDYYRPLVGLTQTFGDWSVTAEDELRIDLTGDRESDFYRNRAFLTCSYQVTPKVSFGLGYVRQEDKVKDAWRGFNALRTLISLQF